MILLWNRVKNLNENENFVLMNRAKMGLKRPLSEAVLEIVPPDSNEKTKNGEEVCWNILLLLGFLEMNNNCIK